MKTKILYIGRKIKPEIERLPTIPNCNPPKVLLRRSHFSDTIPPNMEILVTAAVVAAIVLIGKSAYGFGACALFVAAFMLWWDGQPGRPADSDL